jgi:hypothetical protein
MTYSHLFGVSYLRMTISMRATIASVTAQIGDSELFERLFLSLGLTRISFAMESTVKSSFATSRAMRRAC